MLSSYKIYVPFRKTAEFEYLLLILSELLDTRTKLQGDLCLSSFSFNDFVVIALRYMVKNCQYMAKKESVGLKYFIRLYYAYIHRFFFISACLE